MTKEKVAVIDVDGILWDMSDAWYCEIEDINPDCPFPGKVWDFYKGYLTEKEVAWTANKVHLKQMIYPCFKHANKLTALLKKADYKVIIASHRDPRANSPTRTWLKNNNIYFDDLYTGPDKHPLLDEATIFIDDSPISQQVSLDKGVTTFSIEYPYNKKMNKKGVHTYKDLDALIEGLTLWLKENK